MSFVRACAVLVVASATLFAGVIETACAEGDDTGGARSQPQDLDPAGRATTAAEADADAEADDTGAGAHDHDGCACIGASVAEPRLARTGALFVVPTRLAWRCRRTTDCIRGPPVRA